MGKIKHVNIKNITNFIPFPLCRVSRSLAPKTACAPPMFSRALRALGDRVGLGETCASIISGGCCLSTFVAFEKSS